VNQTSYTAPVTRRPALNPTRTGNREAGSSLIEFALCLPPLLLVMTGIFAFGVAVSNYASLTNAAGIAAMQLSVSRAGPLDPCATVATAVTAAAPNLIPTNLTYLTIINGTSYSGASCSSSSLTAGAAGVLTLGKGTQASVTVTYPCHLSIYRINSFANCTLTAKSSEMVQ